MLPFVLNDYIIRDGPVYAQWYCFQLFGMTLVALVDSDDSFRHLRLEPVVTANNTFSAGVLTYPKFDIQLSVFPAVQYFAFFICGAVYYKLFSILIFLKGIFLYFSRS